MAHQIHLGGNNQVKRWLSLLLCLVIISVLGAGSISAKQSRTSAEEPAALGTGEGTQPAAEDTGTAEEPGIVETAQPGTEEFPTVPASGIGITLDKSTVTVGESISAR